MSDLSRELRGKLADVVDAWARSGMPSRYELEAEAQELLEWKRVRGVSGIWDRPPVMMTATLDDGLGYGLRIVRLYAEVAGVKVISLGVNCSPDEIVADCRRCCPDLLGLTVLRLESEEALAQIGSNLPAGTKLVVGGAAIFRSDPDLARRCEVDYVAENVGAFLQYLLEFR